MVAIFFYTLYLVNPKSLKPEDIYQKNILYACLNWGMGHVSRSIALINRLKKQNNNLYFAGNEDQIRIIKTYFPDISTHIINDYPFKFGTKGNFTLDLLKTIKPLHKSFKNETLECNELTKKLNIDITISDHRYGFKSKTTVNIFLTHQINLPIKWWQFPFQLLHKKLINTFDFIWIPDTDDSKYAGKLSSRSNNPKFITIGIISRFELYPIVTTKTVNSAIIVSGPKTLAHEFLTNQVLLHKSENKEIPVIVCWYDFHPHEVDLLDFKRITNWIEADNIILQSKILISRSGYSTIMDIAYLNCESELTPTKGQKEQEYLYETWKKKKALKSKN
jgi:hypothetical protein